MSEALQPVSRNNGRLQARGLNKLIVPAQTHLQEPANLPAEMIWPIDIPLDFKLGRIQQEGISLQICLARP